MSSSPKFSTHGNWRVVYSDQDEKDEWVADGRKTLADTLSIPKSMCILSDSKTEIPTVTEVDPPRLKLPQLGSDTVERVFPVRSVLSFDSTPSSALQTPSIEKLESPISPFSEGSRASASLDEKLKSQYSEQPEEAESWTRGPKRPNHLSQLRDQKHELGESSTSTLTLPIRDDNRFSKGTQFGDPNETTHDGSSESQLNANVNTRLKDLIHEGGTILKTKKIEKGIEYPRAEDHDDDDDVSIRIQRFGVILVIFQLEGNLTIQAASNNSRDIIGYSPDELFEVPSIYDILSGPHHQAFSSHAETVLDDYYDVEISGPEVFLLFIRAPESDGKRFWCTMHTSKVYKDYIICELEAEKPDYSNVEYNPLEGGENTYHPCEPNLAEEPWFASPSRQGKQDSTTSDTNALDLDAVNRLTPVIHRISSSQTMDALIDHVVSGLMQLLQVHRVTMYHFDGNHNGIVMADSVDPSLDIKSFAGAIFDEGTFTEDAKTQHLRNSVCLSYSFHEDEAELAYISSTTKMGLDLSHCYLTTNPKGVSQKNSPSISVYMSIGIYAFGKLWGLVCCQSYDEKFRLHPLLQRASWLMGQTISSNIERLSYTLPFQLSDKSTNSTNSDSIGKSELSSDLLIHFGADYAAVSILGETKILGKPPDSQEVLVLLEYMRAKGLRTVIWSTDILSDFDDLEYAPGFHHLAGLFYIPLSPEGHDFIVFFRSENQSFHDKRRLERNSKQLGTHQEEWSAGEFGKASILAMMYRTFTNIWQEKEAAMQNDQLLKLLLANSAHEFRTPLNAIINYLEIALDGNLSQETRESLSRSHSASKSLVYIINDLLDLTNAENGQNLIKDEVFSLSETLCEATDIFWEEARQKQVDLQVVQHSALPPVLGDQRRVRQVITNLISNAVQHTSVGAVTIESCLLSDPCCEPGHIVIEVAIHDTGSGMPQETVETLFCQLEQVSNKGDMQSSASGGEASGAAPLGKESVLGLGLALVARIVRNMNGQLSLKSEEGSGSCFKIRLRFPLPENEDAFQLSDGKSDERQEKSAFWDNRQPRNEQDEEVEGNGDPLSCCCGDDASNIEELGQQNGSLVDVDIALKCGESRSIALSSSKQSTIESTAGPHPASNADSKTARPNILVAEDDPINSTIVRKRLEKFGYSVRMTGNGKECASVLQENINAFDAVLMDLQMPIVDGSSATKMIREHEFELSSAHSTLAYGHGRVPIFAVSASLVERDRQDYIDSGFDGWIMKPIDFQRVHVLLNGVSNLEARNSCVYRLGMWEQGGWFERYDADELTEKK
ncbi:CheY-like superfamily [Penicillium waksmanii]|uniref:CheY-like superfamily n=1 Tax=Penicillium waksmanii TaxID=69791 RepID=UPI002548FC87|nr:CheY-like superfamily [Penicillium waksmanii]KAJ5983562.1 CheY-like superfamily [Penicillium waksmanii]